MRAQRAVAGDDPAFQCPVYVPGEDAARAINIAPVIGDALSIREEDGRSEHGFRAEHNLSRSGRHVLDNQLALPVIAFDEHDPPSIGRKASMNFQLGVRSEGNGGNQLAFDRLYGGQHRLAPTLGQACDGEDGHDRGQQCAGGVPPRERRRFGFRWRYLCRHGIRRRIHADRCDLRNQPVADFRQGFNISRPARVIVQNGPQLGDGTRKYFIIDHSPRPDIRNKGFAWNRPAGVGGEAQQYVHENGAQAPIARGATQFICRGVDHKGANTKRLLTAPGRFGWYGHALILRLAHRSTMESGQIGEKTEESFRAGTM